MEGMVIYMLDNVEYPLPKSTLQRMLDQKCEVSEFNEELIHMINLIRGSFPLLEYFPTASEVYSTVSESFPLLKFPLLEGFSTVEVFPLLSKDKDYSKSNAPRAEGKELDEEQLAFLADPRVADDQVAQAITHNVVFQTYDLDAYDSSCDDISSAKPVLMANLSSCDSDVLSEVQYSETFQNDMMNQSVQELQYSEQAPIVNYLDNEITSDSNIIPYSQYLEETQQVIVQNTITYT
ncbi:hypothetical protein Tco_0270789 [Tanacetum coccineum]